MTEKQKEIKEQTPIQERTYINYCAKNKKTRQTETIGIIFKHEHQKIPFKDQEPEKTLKGKELEKEMGWDNEN